MVAGGEILTELERTTRARRHDHGVSSCPSHPNALACDDASDTETCAPTSLAAHCCWDREMRRDSRAREISFTGPSENLSRKFALVRHQLDHTPIQHYATT